MPSQKVSADEMTRLKATFDGAMAGLKGVEPAVFKRIKRDGSAA